MASNVWLSFLFIVPFQIVLKKRESSPGFWGSARWQWRHLGTPASPPGSRRSSQSCDLQIDNVDILRKWEWTTEKKLWLSLKFLILGQVKICYDDSLSVRCNLDLSPSLPVMQWITKERDDPTGWKTEPFFLILLGSNRFEELGRKTSDQRQFLKEVLQIPTGLDPFTFLSRCVSKYEIVNRDTLLALLGRVLSWSAGAGS